LLLLLLCAACGGDEGGDPAAAIDGFDTSAEAGYGPRARLNIAIVAEPEATREAALERLESEDPDVRVAAVYALSITLTAEDANALVPLLESSDPGERVLAAAALLALEDDRALPVLIESLGEDVAIPFGSPPARVWEKARFALLQSTGQDFGLREATTASEAAATVPQWEAWWAEAEATFEIIRAPDQFGQ
jgi:HEAT repeat protein